MNPAMQDMAIALCRTSQASSQLALGIAQGGCVPGSYLATGETALLLGEALGLALTRMPGASPKTLASLAALLKAGAKVVEALADEAATREAAIKAKPAPPSNVTPLAARLRSAPPSRRDEGGDDDCA